MSLPARKPAAVLLLALLTGAPAGHAQVARPSTTELDPAVVQRIDSAFAEWSASDTPGCVAAAERDGRLLFSRAYGMANLEHRVPVTRESVFEAGSISKQFTAAAVLLLVEEGRIQLADDVRRYVPELPDFGGAVLTIDQLLTHSSGVADWGTIMFHAGWPRGDRVYDNAAGLGVITRHPTLIFTPGSFFSYSNSGYALLTEIVERVTGTSLPAFTEERLFRPLGMTATRWRNDYRAIVPGRTTAYRRRGAEFIQDMPFQHTYGSGGLLTTVDDLLTWNRALQERRLGSFVGAEMERRGVDSGGYELPYGRGLWVGTFQGFVELSHGGATAGYRGWLSRYPEAGLSVALLCNGPVNDARLGRTIASELLPDRAAATAAEDPAPSPATALTPAEASDLAGHFVREMLGTPFTVAASGDTLRISGEVATPLGGRTFRISWGDFRFEGRDVLHELNPDGSTFQRFHRIDGPVPESLEPFTGRYRSEAALASYVVTGDAGQLAIQVEGRPEWVLRYTPIGPDVFRSIGTVVRAHRDDSGRVVSLTLSADRLRDLLLTRVEE